MERQELPHLNEQAPSVDESDKTVTENAWMDDEPTIYGRAKSPKLTAVKHVCRTVGVGILGGAVAILGDGDLSRFPPHPSDTGHNIKLAISATTAPSQSGTLSEDTGLS